MRYGSAVRHVSLGSPRVLGRLLATGTGTGNGYDYIYSCGYHNARRGFCLLRVMGRVAWALGELLPEGPPALAPTTRTRLAPRPARLDIKGPLPLPEQVRTAMRLLPNSVVVCTSAQGDAPRGMTMSSFTSLSLSPTPVVSFNVATPSRTLDAIRATREFHIHVMSGDAEGMAVAARFTRGNSDDDAFRGLPYTITTDTTDTTAGGGRVPIPLLGGRAVLFALRCRLLPDGPGGGLVAVRDHVIVLGEVLGVMGGQGTGEYGLAYANRQYRQVGGRP